MDLMTWRELGELRLVSYLLILNFEQQPLECVNLAMVTQYGLRRATKRKRAANLPQNLPLLLKKRRTHLKMVILCLPG